MRGVQQQGATEEGRSATLQGVRASGVVQGEDEEVSLIFSWEGGSRGGGFFFEGERGRGRDEIQLVRMWANVCGVCRMVQFEAR